MGGVPPGYPLPYLQQYAAAQAQVEQLRRFWAEMKEEVSRAGTDPLEFKNQQLPLARIKKVKIGGGAAQGPAAPQAAAPWVFVLPNLAATAGEGAAIHQHGTSRLRGQFLKYCTSLPPSNSIPFLTAEGTLHWEHTLMHHGSTVQRVQIMKSDEDVRMISAEAPVLFAKVRG